MAVIGCLNGIQTVRDAMENPVMGKFIRRLIYDEIVPQIAGDLNELETYAGEVINRFRNPSIDHKLQSITLNSFSKFKVRLLPSLLANIEQNGQIPARLSFTLASLLYFYRDEDEKKNFVINDNREVIDRIQSTWRSNDLSVAQINAMCHNILSDKNLWDTDLSRYPHLTERVSQHLQSILAIGILSSAQQLETNL